MGIVIPFIVLIGIAGVFSYFLRSRTKDIDYMSKELSDIANDINFTFAESKELWEHTEQLYEKTKKSEQEMIEFYGK